MKKYLVPWVVALLLGGGMYGVQAAQEWVGCKYLTGVAGVAITCPDTVGRGGATISGGGGGGVIGSGVTGGDPFAVLFIDSGGLLAQDTSGMYFDPSDPSGFLYFQAPSGSATSYGVINLSATDVEMDLVTPTMAGYFSHAPSNGGLQTSVKVDGGAIGSAEIDALIYDVGGGDPGNNIPHVHLNATSTLGSGRLYLWAPLGGETTTLDLMATTGTNAGPSRMEFFATNNVNSVSIWAPSTVTPRSTASLQLRWPGAAPAATNQALVGELDGDGVNVNLKFAAGKTQAYAVCTGVACATTCTLTFTGGVLTGNSGTCP